MLLVLFFKAFPPSFEDLYIFFWGFSSSPRVTDYGDFCCVNYARVYGDGLRDFNDWIEYLHCNAGSKELIFLYTLKMLRATIQLEQQEQHPPLQQPRHKRSVAPPTDPPSQPTAARPAPPSPPFPLPSTPCNICQYVSYGMRRCDCPPQFVRRAY